MTETAPSSITLRSAVTFALLFILLTAGLGLGIHQVLQNNSLGADFYVFWKSGRVLFLEDGNPYSRQVTEEIQWAVLHRLAEPGQDQLQFSYPAYILVLVLPFNLMSYDWAQAMWMALNLACVLSISFLVFPKTPRAILISLPLMYNILYGSVIGNFSLLISLVLFLFCGYFVIQGGRERAIQVLLGFLLAWSTAKPQSVWLYLIFILLFSLRHRLKPLLLSFFASGILLLTLAFIFQPDWPLRWLENLRIYAGFTGQNRGIIALLGWLTPGALPAQWINTALLVTALLAVPAAARALFVWWKGRLPDFSLLVILAAVTYLLLPNNTSADQMFLLLPLLLWVLWRSPDSRAVQAVWLAALLLSYAIFFASVTNWAPRAVMTWPFALFAAWAAAFFLRRKRQKQV